ncbi:MAG: hypothetical protein A2X58_08390 [Nitrospirae bacterium GWC2_56_14]|nr:MAG: hypothetical protein A2X58_08390 [Nitrospirae bacterium GWC2_56_14]
MSFLDLISELRTKEAKPEKAAKAMKVLALICAIGGIWNYAIPIIAPFNKTPIRIDPAFPIIALMAGMLLAGLFLLASRGIADRAEWGKRLGQLAVVLLVAMIVAGCLVLYSGFSPNIPVPPAPVTAVFSLIFVAQFVVPAFFGIQYLGRLPVDENRYVRPAIRPGIETRVPAAHIERGKSPVVNSYKESPVRFGVVGTFVIFLGIMMFSMFFVMEHIAPAAAVFMFPLMFVVIFVGPAWFNRLPSSFEQTRTVAASYTGGGSMFMFNGSWPFFRLLVYDDGVEIRVMFHRFFIPYDKMEDLPDKIKFFSLGGVLFKSDLPGVPSRIRFHGRSSKKILEFVNERRKKILAMNAETG